MQSARRQFRDDTIRVIDFIESLADCAGIDGDRTVDRGIETEIAAQRLDVAVEDQADHFGVFVDDRRAGVAADNIVGGAEIEFLIEIDA